MIRNVEGMKVIKLNFDYNPGEPRELTTARLLNTIAAIQDAQIVSAINYEFSVRAHRAIRNMAVSTAQVSVWVPDAYNPLPDC